MNLNPRPPMTYPIFSARYRPVVLFPLPGGPHTNTIALEPSRGRTLAYSCLSSWMAAWTEGCTELLGSWPPVRMRWRTVVELRRSTGSRYPVASSQPLPVDECMHGVSKGHRFRTSHPMFCACHHIKLKLMHEKEF